MSAMLAVAVIGTAISAYSKIQASRARAAAARGQALLNFKTGEEILERNELRNKFLKRAGLEFEAKQATSLVKRGLSSTSGTGLLLLEDTQNRVAEQIALNNREAAFRAAIVQRHGIQGLQGALDTERAGYIAGLGTFAYGSATAIRSEPGRRTTNDNNRNRN